MTIRIAACDLGKASAGFVTGRWDEAGRLVIETRDHFVHEGRPLERFVEWYRARDVAGCAALGATGVYADQLIDPVHRAPEDACQEAALEADPSLPSRGALNLVSVGARGFSVLTRTPGPGGPSYRFLDSDKCSSGTGENIQRLAARFGITIEEADRLALAAPTAIPITARCSVFAKSEMTHYANEGRPTGDLFRGYFASLARNTHALLSRNRVDGPVVLVGGCSRVEAFRLAFERLASQPVRGVEFPLAFEATGAALLAGARAAHVRRASLPADPAQLIQVKSRRFAVLPRAREHASLVRHLAAQEAAAGWEREPVVLGLDLGSTGAKAVLTSLRTKLPVLELYDRTRGNPVDAARRLIDAVLAQSAPDVRAIGVTGSGREAVATLLGAVFPGSQQPVVLNEIVAHATAAVSLDPERGADLSVIEIGGQDAKYIRISGGRIVESDMNKACSAGTGSFLEEQAAFYDVHDLDELVRLASSAERPVDLGQMCTVYVAEAASDALKDGFGRADVFAGFQYSILHNYLNRVMGQRTLGKTVFFQGKPATNPSLAWTLAAITGREIVVPPNPGAMGAYGIGLCAIEELGEARLAESAPIDLRRTLRADVAERSVFPCKDRDCSTLCPIQKTVIRVGDEQRIALSGGACPKYENSSKNLPKLDKDAPDPFVRRDELVRSFEVEQPGRPTVAIPHAGPVSGYVPWLATLARGLGYSVRVLRSTEGTLAAGEQLCNSFDSCGPTKITHALCDDPRVGLLLFPKIVELADREGPGGQSCVNEQAMPEIVEQSLRSRGRDVTVVRPVLSFKESFKDDQPNLLRAFRVAVALSQATGESLPPARVAGAAAEAAAAQRDYELRLRELGEEALSYARRRDVPIVVLCGALHVIHDPSVHARIPTLLRQNGAMAIPMDCLPIDPSTPAMEKVYWADSNRAVRAAASARRSGDVFPLMLSSFGCGPASFVEHVFHELLIGYPHSILESDGHGGAAGFVTRIQAFLQSVRQLRAEKAAAERPSADASHLEVGRRGKYLDRSVRYVFLSGTDYLGALLAAVYRSQGYDAVAAPPLTEHNFAAGKADCSGKECLSYQMLWGAFREHLEEHPPDRETRLMQISGQMCRGGMFAVKDTMSIRHMGLGDRVSVYPIRIVGGAGMSSQSWVGLVALDVLRQLFIYHQGEQARPGPSPDQRAPLYHQLCEEVIRLSERRVERHPALHLAAYWRSISRLLEEASAAFRKDSAARGDFRTVFVAGDALTKGNDFANGGLYAHLATRGVRSVMEPLCDFLEFLAFDHPHLLFGRGSDPMTNRLMKVAMTHSRRRLYDLVRRTEPWLPKPDLPAMLARAEPIIDRATNGSAPLEVGSVLHHWERHPFDGVVMTSCWGCSNALVEESLLRHHDDIPFYFHYDDASPLDERRLSSFTFRLGRRAARTGPRPVSP
ncbi:MAG: hypothetical protein HYV09_40130 [Deltaproteobacteria bacterium]|nr:hypothetical protein [Deltaproteobacteria bacterium]